MQAQLTEEEGYELAEVMQKEQNIRTALELATLRQQWVESIEAKNALISKLALNYGLNPKMQLQYDANTRTLMERNGDV